MTKIRIDVQDIELKLTSLPITVETINTFRYIIYGSAANLIMFQCSDSELLEEGKLTTETLEPLIYDGIGDDLYDELMSLICSDKDDLAGMANANKFADEYLEIVVTGIAEAGITLVHVLKDHLNLTLDNASFVLTTTSISLDNDTPPGDSVVYLVG
jgi:hypothetical protein